MEEDNNQEEVIYAPVSHLAISMGAYLKSYLTLVDKLIEKGLHPMDACGMSEKITNNFLNFTNNSKIADNIGNGVEMEFIPEDQE